MLTHPLAERLRNLGMAAMAVDLDLEQVCGGAHRAAAQADAAARQIGVDVQRMDAAGVDAREYAVGDHGGGFVAGDQRTESVSSLACSPARSAPSR